MSDPRSNSFEYAVGEQRYVGTLYKGSAACPLPQLCYCQTGGPKVSLHAIMLSIWWNSAVP